jgi:hypothetical protein
MIRVQRKSVIVFCCVAASLVSCGRPGSSNGRPAPLAGTGAATAVQLFDGTSLDGWDGDPRYWRVEDGTITGETTADAPLERNTFLVSRAEIVGDFVLEFEYVVRSEWANSGVQYRSAEWPAASDADRWIVGGYQADIDEPVVYTGILYGERDRGILANRGERVEIQPGGAPKVVGSIGDADALAKAIGGRNEWNRYRVEAIGTRIAHSINGMQMIEAVDLDDSSRAHDQPGARANGIIALQLHMGKPMKIQFRNLRLEHRGER